MPPIGSDVQDIPVSEAEPTYCTVAQVARVLQKPIPSPDAGEGEPSLQDWKDTIIEAEDEVDQALGTSWRARQRKLEYHPRKTWVSTEQYYRVRLGRGPVKTLSAAQGDVLEVWTGSWEDWLATKTEGRTKDYWLQEPGPWLNIRRSFFHVDYANDPALRVTYRYGHAAIPKLVRAATAKLAAVALIRGDVVGVEGNGGTANRLGVDAKSDRWHREAWAALAPFQKVG